VSACAEQDGLPEVAHDRKVRFEAVHPDFPRTDGLMSAHPRCPIEWFRKDVDDEDLA
jgi:hypothetical protein